MTDLRAIVHDSIELFPTKVVALVIDQLIVDIVEIRMIFDQFHLYGEDVIRTLTDSQIIVGGEFVRDGGILVRCRYFILSTFVSMMDQMFVLHVGLEGVKSKRFLVEIFEGARQMIAFS